MGRTESLNLKNDYERACGWYGHFNKSEMALFSECTDRYAQKLLDTADIVREAILQQLSKEMSPNPSATSDIGLDDPKEDASVEGGITNHHKNRADPPIPMFAASDNGCGDR
jgi:hypothetical protein